eukprot:TRINITY_DN21455_c0_g1_i1.p2 TRINITY_DN21455_c0_g1~~TRINITY_DN21455_c0_g1_i1.p2  ORF type:complete len:118 (+),score=26.46 TRINITY_DN21455_c0_g1_i1:45-356(+)
MLASVLLPAAVGFQEGTLLRAPESGERENVIIAAIFVSMLALCVLAAMVVSCRMKLEEGGIFGEDIFAGGSEYVGFKQGVTDAAVQKAKEDPQAVAQAARALA